MATREGRPEVVLASGGARGITARCVVALAARYGWRFILLGRTPTDDPLPLWAVHGMTESELKHRLAADLASDPERAGKPVRPAEIQHSYEHVRGRLEIEATLRAVAAEGGEAEYVCADVAGGSLRGLLEPAIARQGGTVSGIVHGAGVVSDRAFEDKRAADFDRVFAPKARGLRTLLDAVDPDDLRFLVLFSSAAGFYGHAGQADYALANEVLNKAAHRLRAQLPRCRVVAFDWGPWDGDAGMVTPALRRHFESRGVALIPPEAGTRIVADALAFDAAPPVQVLVGSPLPSPPPPPEAAPLARRIVRCLGVKSEPFLLDHVIGGRPVLPVTCAMTWIADACEGCYPGLSAVRLENCRVLGGVVLGDEEVELTLELDETSRDMGGSEVRVHAEISSVRADARTQPHYRAEVVLARERPAPPRASPESPAATPDAAEGPGLYVDGTLFHGPAFRGVRRLLSYGDHGLVLECRVAPVPEHVQGRFRAGSVNPYVADALFQGIVVWARRACGAASLPVCTTAAELYRPLEFDRTYTVSVNLREREEHRLVADIDASDAEGDVCLRLVGAEVALSSSLARLFAPASVPATGVA